MKQWIDSRMRPGSASKPSLVRRHSLASNILLPLGFLFSNQVLMPQSLERASAASATPPATTEQTSQSVRPRNSNEIVEDTPLWIQLDRSSPMRPQAPVAGHMTTDVYVVDKLLVPAGSLVTGHIAATRPVPKSERRAALLDGDLTPLKNATISFDSVTLPDGRSFPIHADAEQRDASLIAMRPPTTKRTSAFARIRNSVRTRVSETEQTFTAPRKGERFRRFIYGQLPWHPQTVWFDTQYVAELTSPAIVPSAPHVPPKTAVNGAANGGQDALTALSAPGGSPASTGGTSTLSAAELRVLLPQVQLEARLEDDLSSRTAKSGDPVAAILTRPVFAPVDATHPDQRLVFPEGTRLSGAVLQAKAARNWGRNGTMRFTFRSIEAPEAPKVAVQAQVAAIDGQNLTVDSEGGTKANPDKNRVLGPLTLAFLAGSGADGDHLAGHGAVGGNSLGLLGRIAVIGIANQYVTIAAGTLAFGTSVYRHWIARGHDVVFPRDTRMIISAAQH